MAKAKGEYSDTMRKLSAMVKDKPVSTPIQEVRPVEPPTPQPVKANSKAAGKSHLNCWIPNELMQQLKFHAVRSGKSIKQISIEALEQYLPKDKQ